MGPGRAVPLLASLLGLVLPLAHTTDMNMYRRMPKLFELEDYDDCMADVNGSYCLVDIELRVEDPAVEEVFEFIKEYSAFTRRTYRHDIVHRGICESSCSEGLEGCALRGLRGRGWGGVVHPLGCVRNSTDPPGAINWVLLAFLLSILVANVVCSVYCTVNEQDSSIRKWAETFSMQENWRQLQRPSSLPGVQGLRLLTMLCVIGSHVFVVISFGYVSNPHFLEKYYEYVPTQMVTNGTVIIQVFLCMTSFLMTIHFLKHTEKNPKFNIWMYPYTVLQRWLRLLPVYGLVIWILASGMEWVGSGPLWMAVAGPDRNDCQSTWWHNLLYIHNIMGTLSCLPQAWYSSVDFQLFCMTLLILMGLWRFPGATRPVLGTALVAGAIVPGVITYYYDYSPLVNISPQSMRGTFFEDPTFIHVYTQMYGNMSGYIAGAIAGYTQFYIEKDQIKLSVKKMKLYLYSSFFGFVALFLVGGYFGRDDYVSNPVLAGLYTSLLKPVFGGFVCVLLITMSNDIKSHLRSAVEMLPAEVLGKLSYSAYFIHIIVQASYVGLQKRPIELSEYNIFHFVVSSVVITFGLSLPMWLMVEKPFCNLQKLVFDSTPRKCDSKTGSPSSGGEIQSSSDL